MEKPNKRKGYHTHFHKNNSVQKESIQIIKPVNMFDKSKRIADVFNLYLSNESYEEYNNYNVKTKAIEYFLSKCNYHLKDVSQSKHFTVDVTVILKDKEFMSQCPEFLQDLISSPNKVIGLFGFVMEKIIMSSHSNDEDGATSETIDEEVDAISETIPTKLNPRFIGLPNHLSFQDMKMHNCGKFVSLIGTVVRVSDVKPFCTCMAFKCVKCPSTQVVIQNKGCYTPPSTCEGDGCFSRAFKPLLSSSLTVTIPKKKIRLQEMNVDHGEGGRVPRTVECELTSDLTKLCMPGDAVILSGIVITNPIEEGKTGKDACSYILSIYANSVVCLKGKNVDPASGCLDMKSEDLERIKRIQAEKDLFKLLVASLCPNIYGHELIKAGLMLALVGGRNRTHEDGKKSEFSIRENSHILIVGDPGLGKSQMLLACANVSPRGVYVCGNSTTSSGLTATIVKESGDNSLEAGALVLADQGHCCIDEFDKMVHQHSSLLEAMEQQTISLAKSGVVCTLQARMSILAAANPSGGHYNRAKTVSENLRIGGSLLSRFDLVFIVEDKPDDETDNKMSKHIMGLHTNNITETASASIYFANTNDENNSLLNTLKVKPKEKLNLIPAPLLQKYISYVRKFPQPKLTPEASECLKSFYLNMRKQHKLSYSTPITTRQLESLIRLTEARARSELRAYCTKRDAEEVIEIMKFSMRETYSDEFGNLDFDRSIHGSGMSKASQAKKLISMMTATASQRGDDCFTVAEIQQLSNKIKIPPDSVHSLITSLNDQGFILKKGLQLYQIQTL